MTPRFLARQRRKSVQGLIIFLTVLAVQSSTAQRGAVRSDQKDSSSDSPGAKKRSDGNDKRTAALSRAQDLVSQGKTRLNALPASLAPRVLLEIAEAEKNCFPEQAAEDYAQAFALAMALPQPAKSSITTEMMRRAVAVLVVRGLLQPPESRADLKEKWQEQALRLASHSQNYRELDVFDLYEPLIDVKVARGDTESASGLFLEAVTKSARFPYHLSGRLLQNEAFETATKALILAVATEALQRAQPDLYAAYGFLVANRRRIPPVRFGGLLDGLFDAAISAADPVYDQLLAHIINDMRSEDKDKAGRLFARLRDPRILEKFESAQSSGNAASDDWWEPSPSVERAAETARAKPETAVAILQTFPSQRDRQVFGLITAQLLRDSHPHISAQLATQVFQISERERQDVIASALALGFASELLALSPTPEGIGAYRSLLRRLDSALSRFDDMKESGPEDKAQVHDFLALKRATKIYSHGPKILGPAFDQEVSSLRILNAGMVLSGAISGICSDLR